MNVGDSRTERFADRFYLSGDSDRVDQHHRIHRSIQQLPRQSVGNPSPPCLTIKRVTATLQRCAFGLSLEKSVY